MGSSETVYLLSYADSEDSVDLSTSTMDLLVVKQQKDSLSLAIAAELAVELINNRTDILPGPVAIHWSYSRERVGVPRLTMCLFFKTCSTD